jgi:hypothetical protein
MDIRTIYELTSIVEYENVFYTCMYATASSITPFTIVMLIKIMKQ